MALTRINNQALTNVTAAGLPSGTVLQVKHSELTTKVTLDVTGTWRDIGTVTITPTSSDTNILINWSVQSYVQNQSNVWVAVNLRLLRGTTEIWTDGGDKYALGKYSDSSSDRIMAYAVNQFEDASHNTTSAITYKLQGTRSQGTVINYMNDPAHGGGGSLTAMEIAG